MALDNAYKIKIIRNLGPSALAAYRAGDVTDDDLELYAEAMGISPDDFSGVTTRADSTATVPEARPADSEAGFLDSRMADLSGQVDQVSDLGSAALDSVQSYAQRRLSSDIFNAQDQAALAQANRPGWAQDSVVGDVLYGTPFAGLTQMADVAVSRLARGQAASEGGFSERAILDEAGRLRSESLANRQAAEEGVQGITTARGFAEGIVDVAGSPSSSLSVFGGPFGALPVAEIYQDTFAEARLAGLSPEEARAQATLQAAPEAIGFIPAGQFLNRIPGASAVKKALANEVSSTAARVSTRLAATSLGEGAEEGLTQLLQTGANAAIAATTDSDAAREYAEAQLPKNAADLWNQVWRATKAGMIGGTALGAPHVGYGVAIENANAYMDTLNNGLDASKEASQTAIKLPPVAEQVATLAEQPIAPTEVVTEDMREGLRQAGVPEDVVQKISPASAKKRLARAAKKAEVAPTVETAPVAAQGALEAAPVQTLPTPAPVTVPDEETVAREAREQEVRASLTELFPDTDPAEIDRMTLEELTPAPTQLARIADPQGNYQNSAEAVVRDIAGRVRGGNDKVANSIGKLIAKKKLVVVDDETQIPNFDSRLAGASGIYDSKSGKMYAVANRINPDNMVGELLHVAAHETKHLADTSGNAELSRGSLSAFVGTKANQKFNQKLNALASQGNTLAQQTLDNVPQNLTPAEKALEAPAYALNVALDTKGNLGGFAGLKRDLISAVRTNAKAKLGIDDVNENDLVYFAKKLVERSALSEAPTTGDGTVPAQQAMIYGAKSTQFRDALRRGITFTAKDGSTKYVLSDKDSTIKPAAVDKLTNEDSVRLESVLRHPTLYEQYPELRDLPVSMEPQKDAGVGVFYSSDPARNIPRRIALSPDIVNDREFVGPKGDIFSMRTALLHEVQHAIQDIEGQKGAFNEDAVLSKENKDALLRHRKVRTSLDALERRLLTKLDGLARSNEVNPQQKRILLSVINDPNIRDSEKVKEATSFVEDNNIFVDEKLAEVMAEHETARLAYNETVPEFNAIADRRYEAYRRNTAEQDAFFTQNNADVAQGNLPINPEETYERAIDIPGQLAMMRLPAVKESILEATRAARAKGVAGQDNKFWNTVFGAVSYTGGLGKEIRDKIDLSVGNAANISEMARHNMKNLELGIEALAARWVKEGKAPNQDAGVDQINAMLFRRIKALQTIDSIPRRENAIAGLVTQYPELRPFARAMADIRELTEALVKQHRAATPNPTPKDKEFQQDLLDNVLSYTSRMYGAFQGPAGRKHSRKFVEDAKKAQQKLREGKPVTAAEKEANNIYKAAVDYLIENDIDIPDEAGLAKLKTGRLNDLYNTWMPQQAADVRAIVADQIAKGMNMSPEDAEAYANQTLREQLLQKKAEINPEDLLQKADAAVKELLRLRGAQGPVAQRYAGLDVDRGIFKKRTAIPHEIRDLLGEIKDPVTMLGVTQAKQGELLARNKLLMQLRDAGLVVTQDKANTPEFSAFTERLSGEGAGPLKDHYTTPRVAAAIRSSVEMYSQVTDAVANAWLDTDGPAQAGLRGSLAIVRWGAGKAKVLSLIAELFGTTANALGSPVMLAANGVIDPRSIKRGAGAGLNSIADVMFDGKGEVSPLLARGIKYQVVDSARVQELRRSANKYIKTKLRNETKVTSGLRKGIGTGWATAVETFAMSDAWVKLAAFEDRSNYLREYYRAEGVKKTPGEIDEESANDIRDSNITYGKTPPILRTFESVGMTTFIPYFYNVPRSLIRSMYLAGQDIMRAKQATTPEGRNLAAAAGIKRALGTSAAMAAVPAITSTMAKWVSKLVMPGDDDEEKDKKLEAMKMTLPRESRFGDPVYLGQDKKDRPVFFRASRFDPYGPVTDLVRIALDDNITASEASDQMAHALTSLIFTNRFTGAAVETIGGDTPTNQETRLERTLPQITAAMKAVIKPVIGFQGAKGAMRLLDSFAPGQIDAFDPANTGVASDGTELSELLSNMVVGAGGRLDKGDPGARSRQLGFEVREIRKKAREELFDAVTSRSSPATMEKIIKDASFDIYDRMSQFSDVYDGATEGMGMSPRKAMQILKEEGKLNANEIASVRKGIPKTYEQEDLAIELGRILSKKSIEQRTKKRQRYETEEETRQFEKETKELINELKTKGYKENK